MPGHPQQTDSSSSSSSSKTAPDETKKHKKLVVRENALFKKKLSVEGKTELGHLEVHCDAHFHQTLHAKGDAHLGSNLSVGGDASFQGAIYTNVQFVNKPTDCEDAYILQPSDYVLLVDNVEVVFPQGADGRTVIVKNVGSCSTVRVKGKLFDDACFFLKPKEFATFVFHGCKWFQIA